MLAIALRDVIGWRGLFWIGALPVVLSAGLLEAGVWHAQERLQHAARASLNLGELRRRGLPTVLAGSSGFVYYVSVAGVTGAGARPPVHSSS